MSCRRYAWGPSWGERNPYDQIAGTAIDFRVLDLRVLRDRLTGKEVFPSGLRAFSC